MPDPTTPAKGLTQPLVDGDNNTWGGLLNTDLALIDSAIGGTLAKSISGNVTLTRTETQNTGYEFTGTLSGNATITWPSFFGQATILNATTGGFSIVCGMGGASVSVLNGDTVSVWSDGTDFILISGGGGALNGTSTNQSTTYTVANSDKRSTINLGGNNCFTVTVPAASGFDSDFQVRLYNRDAGRAKNIAVNGLSSFFLWPKQNVVVQNINGNWRLFPAAQRWSNPSSPFFVDPSGSDAGGSNDGLTQGSAFATIANAWNTILYQTDGAMTPSIQLTPGATYTISALQQLSGDSGFGFGRLLLITGDPTLANPPILTASTSITAFFQFRDGLWASLDGISFQSTGTFNVGVQPYQGSLCDISNCIWNLASGIAINPQHNSLVNVLGTHEIQSTSGSALSFVIANDGSSVVFDAPTINGGGIACNFTDGFINADLCSRVAYNAGTTFTNVGSFTGPKYALTHGSFFSQQGITTPGSAGSADATSVAY